MILFFAALDLTFTTRHIPNQALFLLWLSLFILSAALSPLFPNSILNTCWAEVGGWVSSSSFYMFLPFTLFLGFSRQGSVQFSSVSQLCLTLCDPMNGSTPGFPVHHQLPELTQTHVHTVGDAIQPSHPLSSSSPPAFNLSQHQGLFQWISSSHQVARVLEFQLQHHSFQWIFSTDFL